MNKKLKRLAISLIPGIILGLILYYSGDFTPNTFLRISGRLAFFYFFLALSVTPVNTILKTQKYLAFRKIFGILGTYFAFFHASKYFYDAYSFGELGSIWTSFAPDFLSGLTAFVFLLPLAFTSNNFAVKQLGSTWAVVQSLAYPLYLLSLIHIAFTGQMSTFYVVLTALLVSLRSYAYLGKKEIEGKIFTGKYVCIPCGYIYDPELGDPDGGIAPGTRFEDIPDTWRCPVCFVTKKDFKQVGDDFAADEFFEAKVVSTEYVNTDKNVLELLVELSKDLPYTPGQYFSFIFSDHDGEYRRSFSIANKNANLYTFLIRIDECGRAGKFLKDIHPGVMLKVRGIYGTFLLQDTKNNKVFIATGTGLAPIYNMVSESNKGRNLLVFGSKNRGDLFYESEMGAIESVEKVYICFSREDTVQENSGKVEYKLGRMDIDGILSENKDFSSHDSEFYVCGNPKMVEDTVAKLKTLGYENIYIEKF